MHLIKQALVFMPHTRPGSDLRFGNSTHLKVIQLTSRLSRNLFFQLTSKFCDSLFDLGLMVHLYTLLIYAPEAVERTNIAPIRLIADYRSSLVGL